MARRENGTLDTWFDLSVDPESRTIYMGSVMKLDDSEAGVDNFMAEYFIKGMHVLESKGNKDITIIMNNPGGDWYHGMAIYDAIKQSSCFCTIKVYGHAMSMGSLILQAADHRTMMPNSRMMIHYGYNGHNNHTKVSERWSDEGKRLNRAMEDILLESMLKKEEKEGHGHLSKILSGVVNELRAMEYPPKPPEEIVFSKAKAKKSEEVRAMLSKLLDFDTLLTPQQCVDLGLADEVYLVPREEEEKE